MARILIVDDDPSVRESIGAMLAATGHEVRCAPDGHAGESVAAAFRPTVAIVDILMPVREGLETIVALRRSWPSLRILAISGGGRTGRLDFLTAAEHFGADAVLPKPFAATELLAALDKLLSAKPP